MGCWIPNIKINHCPDTPFRYLNFKHESSVVDTTDVHACKAFGKELTTLSTAKTTNDTDAERETPPVAC